MEVPNLLVKTKMRKVMPPPFEKDFMSKSVKIFHHIFDTAHNHAVSGQNTIGIYITPLVLIQPTDDKQNAVNNNWLLKLQPAVTLQSW